MTPAAQYAQKREAAVELIRTHAPPRLQDALIELLRPAIALQATRADDAQIPLGASKFGGAPDVPADFEWPLWNDKPLGFLAQINLEEVALFDMEELLPKSGLLSFFYFLGDRETDCSWGNPQDFGAWRTLHFDKPAKRHNLPDYFEKNRFLSAAQLTLSAQMTLPSDYDCYPQLGLNYENLEDEGWQAMEKLDEFLSPGANQIFGHARCVQRHPGTEVEGYERDFKSGQKFGRWPNLHEKADDWLLLFQLDSEAEIGAMWGDCGILYFMIRPENLAARQFENTWFTLQCT